MNFSVKERRFVNAVTLCSTFLLGYLNAYSYVFNQSSYVTPQTGNLVNLGLAIAREDTASSILNFMLLIGFAIGCVIGAVLLMKIELTHRFLIITWSVFTGLLMLVYLLNASLSQPFSVILLATLSGFALTLFRKIEMVDVNNGIMTGNFKNLYANFCGGIGARDQKQLMKAVIYLVVIVTFFSGCILGGYMSNFGEGATLIFSFAFCLLPYAFLIQFKSVRKDVN